MIIINFLKTFYNQITEPIAGHIPSNERFKYPHRYLCLYRLDPQYYCLFIFKVTLLAESTFEYIV